MAYYEINVFSRGQHFFATASRSLANEAEAFNAFQIFKKKFPESEGFRVTVTEYQTMGKEVNFSVV